MPKPPDLVARVLRGDQAAVSRALSLVCDEGKGCEALAKAVFRERRPSHKIGLCGAPGSGKSSLVNRLVRVYRDAGHRVGVLAVDPTSPFTGGAFLGDRLRIQEHALDEGVFVRSLSTQGMMGGLNPSIFGAMHVLEAAGYDRILIETVGTGQDEVDIADAVDTVLCVTAPYQGDEFQAMKAGFTEIADIFVVNKADLDEAERAIGAIREALSLGEAGADAGAWAGHHASAGTAAAASPPPSWWKVRIAATSALSGKGIGGLVELIEEHRTALEESGEGLRREAKQARKELSMLVARRIYQDTVSRISEQDIESLVKRKTDPTSLGKRLMKGKAR